MIAPITQRPDVIQRSQATQQHAVAIEDDEQRIVRKIGRLVEKQPAAALTFALAAGMTIGWLVKRKNW
ncbi:hypothetical protein [Aporhodopirellula aestuarii]|uniref:Uncharacterized protein n=1 Tax=Aporhodopirellula aestuarii TaxID=2950107 RepID=A0ABT0U476_9BACT|nr:hypothetical protein [Aporhodopirellula aestuarii]MCM2371655.1 hypothetical protein [Aporhodopirellula aestuarii]